MDEKDESEPVVVLTTFPNDGDVRAFALALVGDRQAACVTVLPAGESVYRWEGVVEQACERQLVIKTTRGMVDTLRRRVAALHPYDTPEFVVLDPAHVAQPYLAWLRASVAEDEGA